MTKGLKSTIRAYGESAVDSAQTAQLFLQRCEQGDSPSCKTLSRTLASWETSAKTLMDLE